MKKRIINYAVKIANTANYWVNTGYQIIAGKRVFVIDGVRLMELEYPIDNLRISVREDFKDGIYRYFDGVNDPANDYQPITINTTYIKDGIRSVCGRKLTRVAWNPYRDLVVDSRYVLKSAEALNAKKMWIAKANTSKMPVFMCEDDDVNNINRILIMPMIWRNIEAEFFNAEMEN